MYHCNRPIYKYDYQEGRDVWFSCGMCAICEVYHLEAFQVEVDSISWQIIQEYMKYYFLALEEPLLDEAVSCQDPLEYIGMLTNDGETDIKQCDMCPRCKKRKATEEQEALQYAEAAAYH